MNFEEFIKKFDKQWHLESSDKFAVYYQVKDNLTIRYYFKDKSFYLDDQTKKKHRTSIMYQNGIITFCQQKISLYFDSEIQEFNFPMCWSEEEFFMNSTAYDATLYSLESLKKFEKLYNKMINIIEYGGFKKCSKNR